VHAELRSSTVDGEDTRESRDDGADGGPAARVRPIVTSSMMDNLKRIEWRQY